MIKDTQIVLQLYYTQILPTLYTNPSAGLMFDKPLLMYTILCIRASFTPDVWCNLLFSTFYLCSWSSILYYTISMGYGEISNQTIAEKHCRHHFQASGSNRCWFEDQIGRLQQLEGKPTELGEETNVSVRMVQSIVRTVSLTFSFFSISAWILVAVCWHATWLIWLKRSTSFLIPSTWQRCWWSYQSKLFSIHDEVEWMNVEEWCYCICK